MVYQVNVKLLLMPSLHFYVLILKIVYIDLGLVHDFRLVCLSPITASDYVVE